MIRYGIIGAGMMGVEHIDNLKLIDGTCIAGIADPDEAMLTAAGSRVNGNATLYHDYRELLSAEICDAYIVAAPNDKHYAIMLDAIAANRPILCEKPFCTTSRDCRTLIDRASRAKLPVWIAMEYRYMPPTAGLLAKLQTGVIGRPIMASIREHRFPFLRKVGDWNRFNLRTGGTLVEKCCHFWDLFRLMLDSDPVRVYASASIDTNHLEERYDGRQPDIFDNGFAILDFANRTRACLDLCMFAEGSDWQDTITVTGTRGRLQARIPAASQRRLTKRELNATVAHADRASQTETVTEIPVDPAILSAGEHHGATYFQHLKFLDLVRTGHGQPEVSMVDGLWSVRIGEAAESSARIGRAYDLG